MEIVEGKFLPANRVFLEVNGSGVEGLMTGYATKDGLDFLYKIGFGSGAAHLKKLTTPAKGKIALQE